jgi:C1A family cysteine protease
MSKAMRCKVQVCSVQPQGPCAELVVFNAVSKKDGYPADGSDEDNTFAKFTPTATLSLQITNTELIGKYKMGDKFYVDFTPVPEAVKHQPV